MTFVWIVAIVLIAFVVLSRLRSRGPRLPGDVNPSTASDEDVKRLALAGRKIEAIKLYRRLHGIDLKGAKDAVDGMTK